MSDGRTYMAVLLLLIATLQLAGQLSFQSAQSIHGAIVRGDRSVKELALVFTGDEYADGGMHIAKVLERQEIRASFFFTGKFYRNPEFEVMIRNLAESKHYLAAHSDQHLLYCDWENRDSLLVTRENFCMDLQENYKAMKSFGITKEDASYFLPPYEWYDDTISAWTHAMGLQLINHTHGTLSHADYTIPGTKGYRSSEEIFQSILDYETSASDGLNGFILLSHIGTVPERTDKFYFYLEKMVEELKSRAYRFKGIDELLDQAPH